MKLGIVGLPNVGKSTLFNAITSTKNAEAANYPFCTIEPNSGIVAVPDPRLDKLAELWQTNKKTPAIVEFVDIAGLVKGASQGAGLGNKFLGHIRECDAIVHVVRCFDDDNIIHVVEDVTKAEAVDPLADIDAIDYELDPLGPGSGAEPGRPHGQSRQERQQQGRCRRGRLAGEPGCPPERRPPCPRVRL